MSVQEVFYIIVTCDNACGTEVTLEARKSPGLLSLRYQGWAINLIPRCMRAICPDCRPHDERASTHAPSRKKNPYPLTTPETAERLKNALRRQYAP